MQQWIPTVKLKWLRTIDGAATLMQLHYCYEIDDHGFCGAKLDEKWRAIEIDQEK
jgi:hypothetical protein